MSRDYLETRRWLGFANEFPELARAIEGGAFLTEALAYAFAPGDTRRELAAIDALDAAVTAFLGRPTPPLLADRGPPVRGTEFGLAILNSLWDEHDLKNAPVDTPTEAEVIEMREAGEPGKGA